MLKKLMSFLFEEEEEEVYADGELEEAIFKDVPKKNIAPEPIESQPKPVAHPAPKPQPVAKTQVASTPLQTTIVNEPKKFTSIDLEPKKAVGSEAKSVTRRKSIIADAPVRNEKQKTDFNFAPIISPIFGSNDENNSSPLEAKVAATGGTKLKKTIDIISPMYGLSADESTTLKNAKAVEGKRHAASPKIELESSSERSEIPDLTLAEMIKKDEEVEDDSMQISLFGEDAPIRDDANSDYKIEE